MTDCADSFMLPEDPDVSEEMFVEDWLPQAARNRHIIKYKYFLMVSLLY